MNLLACWAHRDYNRRQAPKLTFRYRETLNCKEYYLAVGIQIVLFPRVIQVSTRERQNRLDVFRHIADGSEVTTYSRIPDTADSALIHELLASSSRWLLHKEGCIMKGVHYINVKTQCRSSIGCFWQNWKALERSKLTTQDSAWNGTYTRTTWTSRVKLTNYQTNQTSVSVSDRLGQFMLLLLLIFISLICQD